MGIILIYLVISFINNPNLECIEVDDVAYSTTFWTNIDATSSFGTDCSVLGTIKKTSFDYKIDVYPNPTKNNVHINFKKFGDYSFSVYNISGQEIFQQQQMEVNNTFDFSKYASGIYILKIREKSKNTFQNVKIVKM